MALRRVLGMLAVCLCALACSAGTAAAFCGFYVGSPGARLTNDATQVVLLREGTRTVLSMQNNYQGPPQNFAMVVPVPVVLQKENVKTLSRAVFDAVDQLTAPRLVEYWEQDPCPQPVYSGGCPMCGAGQGGAPSAALNDLGKGQSPAPPPVRIEAQFVVGEYDIVILSATDSTALDAWLHQSGYNIPDGAEPYLRPYVQMGMKFFVAKVDVSKVKFERIGSGPERAMLSPLRFYYDSDEFYLPIRLGLVNSGGTQDLVVTILAQGQRYEVANYDNVAIPTNVNVASGTRNTFGAFYAGLFDRTLARHPHAVVTEYSWAANTCDPCPTPPLRPNDLTVLGADVTPSQSTGGYVITRLHARYGKNALGDDLFFRAAPPIVGGREFLERDGKLEQGARPASVNNFQARYAIRHPWTGPMACSNPRRNVWGGNPASTTSPPYAGGLGGLGGLGGIGFGGGPPPPPMPAQRIGLVPRGGVQIDALIRTPAAETMLSSGGPAPVLSIPATQPAAPDAGTVAEAGAIDATAEAAPTPPLPIPAPSATAVPATPPAPGGCGGCAMVAPRAAPPGAIAALLGVWLLRRRRRA